MRAGRQNFETEIRPRFNFENLYREKGIPGSAVRKTTNEKLANVSLINFILIGHSLHIKCFSLDAFFLTPSLSLFFISSSLKVKSLNIAFYSRNKSKCALLTYLFVCLLAY